MTIISLIVVIHSISDHAFPLLLSLPLLMRPFFFASTLILLYSVQSAAAQSTSSTLSPPSANPQERIALSAQPEKAPASRRPRLACAPLDGQVFDPNGQPLPGATLLIKGTHQVYVTDSEGKFQLTEPVYQGQVLTIEAAGYVPRDISLADCTLPRLVLEQATGAHIRRSGKRAGQVTRLNHRSTNIK